MSQKAEYLIAAATTLYIVLVVWGATVWHSGYEGNPLSLFWIVPCDAIAHIAASPILCLLSGLVIGGMVAHVAHHLRIHFSTEWRR